MRRRWVFVALAVFGCAKPRPELFVQPDARCAWIAERLGAVSAAAAIQVRECSPTRLYVAYVVPEGLETGPVSDQVEQLAQEAWDASDRRAAFVQLGVQQADFEGRQCFATTPWRAVADCEPSDTRSPAERADVRVRVWDHAKGGYLRTSYSLLKPDGRTQSFLAAGTQADGWGAQYALPPGRYAILISDIPCGSETFFLAQTIERWFTAKAGRAESVTVRLDSRQLKMRGSHNNREARSCQSVHGSQP